MFEIEGFAQNLVKYVATYLSLAAVLLLVALKSVPILRRIVFPFLYCRLSKSFYENLGKQKIEMLTDLVHTKSYDHKLRAKGSIRLLEVGAGPGANFKYYPDNAQLVILEPNEFFIKYLNENRSKYPNLQVERMILGVGEDMSKVEDNSIDAVVATHVLCSVNDVSAVLKEIHRVLVPGGKYYFMEHGYGVRSWWLWTVQQVVNPFWKLFTNGCQLIKDTIQDITHCGLFIDVQSKTFIAPPQSSWFLKLCLGTNVYGSAQKPINSLVRSL